MAGHAERGILVLDVGATNTKALLFDDALNLLQMESIASVRHEAPPYIGIDPDPILDFAAQVVPAFDAICPVDVLVPCTHGSAVALLDEVGRTALPLMDYNAVPPAEIVEAYATIAPPFAEVLAPINPASLTLGRQLYWQSKAWPDRFSSVKNIVPFAQALAHWLGGGIVSEVTSWGAQTQLWDLRRAQPSSLARDMGWSGLMPPPVPAWQAVGFLKDRFRGKSFTGRGEIRTGIHDSSANFLRYHGQLEERFALLSTGTWIIGLDAGADPDRLDPKRDTACGVTLSGKPVPICRFKGGEEYALIRATGPASTKASIDRLLADGVMALPNFTRSGGPLGGPDGMISGDIGDGEREALAALYCALMSVLALEAMSGDVPDPVIVDGPFSRNALYLDLLAGLLPAGRVYASSLQEGTATGAALLGLADPRNGLMPKLPIPLTPVTARRNPALLDYQDAWRAAATARL